MLLFWIRPFFIFYARLPSKKSRSIEGRSNFDIFIVRTRVRVRLKTRA
jgi:hypothetical protein